MLFAAVTLGFLAENLREHQVINHRIEQNKIAIYMDLQADSSEIARVLSAEAANEYKLTNYIFIELIENIFSNN